MRIISFQITNYKSFLSSHEFRFMPGLNVIVGQNNVGKTALVEALSLQFNNNPHRSLKSIPYPGAAPEPNSQATIEFELSADELVQILQDNLPSFYVPINTASSNAETQAETFLRLFDGNVLFRCTYQPNKFLSASFPAYGEFNSGLMNKFSIKRSDKKPTFVQQNIGLSNFTDTVPFQIASLLRDRIYYFNAERYGLGEGKIVTSPQLAPNATNLAGVLMLLQSSNPARFQRLNDLVNIVLQEVKQISVLPTSQTSARILVWTIDPQTERDDLALPLAESGTGIGQVLAILYVIITFDYPRVIVIDEPQSFLHPGAVRKLLDILKLNTQHQYIITTHSPTVVAAIKPQTLHLIRKKDAESVFVEIDTAETEQLNVFLAEVGARLSDVFGADNILWVEGRTEELCFPLILNELAQKAYMGTEIIGVRQTGDFDGKHSKTIWEIYRKLCQGRGLLPPAIGFLFDQEGRTEKEQQDLIRQSNGTVHFLSRRMYENYILNSRAIALVTSSIQGFRDHPVTVDEVENWLDRNRWNRKYIKTEIIKEHRTIDRWLQVVHGAKVLHELFNELSENRISYDKVEYGVMLTKWILKNAPEDLFEVSELLKTVLSSKKLTRNSS